MALTTQLDPATGSRPPGERIAGLDVVRAVALIGVVVMNYHGYLILLGAERGTDPVERFFDPWTGPLATRFAATFVLVAGIGVSLMTERLRTADPSDPESAADVRSAVTAMRWRFVRRGLVLYVVGQAIEQTWPGTILIYYGALFVLAAVLFRLRDAAIVSIGIGAVVASVVLQVWLFRQAEAGESTAWLTSPAGASWQDRIFEIVVNGTHPLVPWLAFFCAGIVLGRHLRDVRWTMGAAMLGVFLFFAAGILNGAATTPFQARMLSDDPSSRSAVYVASALGTALIATIGILRLVDGATRTRRARHAPESPIEFDMGRQIAEVLGRAGQMSLTIYLLHVAVFRLLVDGLGVIEPAGLGTALAFAAAFWVVAIAAANAWHRRFGRGPAEVVYRRLGG
ncbi:MAG: DUF418 domain-containing protein [Actinomycetota bacterium]